MFISNQQNTAKRYIVFLFVNVKNILQEEIMHILGSMLAEFLFSQQRCDFLCIV